MPLFFFHVRGSDQELSCDKVGLDFPDVRTAYVLTLSAAWEVGAELGASGLSPQNCTIEVTNAANELVFILPFPEVLEYKADYVRGLLQ